MNLAEMNKKKPFKWITELPLQGVSYRRRRLIMVAILLLLTFAVQGCSRTARYPSTLPLNNMESEIQGVYRVYDDSYGETNYRLRKTVLITQVDDIIFNSRFFQPLILSLIVDPGAHSLVIECIFEEKRVRTRRPDLYSTVFEYQTTIDFEGEPGVTYALKCDRNRQNDVVWLERNLL